MKRSGVWILAVGVLAGFSALGAGKMLNQASENSTATNSAGIDKLWSDMYAAGMIDDAQYQHVLDNGSLPGGSVVTNSLVPLTEQAGWTRLQKHQVITPTELAAVLFNGRIPDMTAEETKAFAELAPIYRPERGKRLTYEVRRKHARVELIRMSHRFHKEHEVRAANLEERARRLGIPMKRGEAVLVGIDENDRPIYFSPLGMGSCDTISTDEVWTTNAVGTINTNFNLTGAGVTLAMWEPKTPNPEHQEFAGRVVNISTATFDKHASAVAAVMAGAGVTNQARGMAYGANLQVYNSNLDHLPALAMVATNSSIRFSNHSYRFILDDYGEYLFPSHERDEIVYNSFWHLPVVAVGNERLGYSGYNTLVAGIAKNVLSVGPCWNGPAATRGRRAWR